MNRFASISRLAILTTLAAIAGAAPAAAQDSPRSARPVLEVARFDFPSSMLETAVRYREALVAQLHQSNRFRFQGQLPGTNNNPNSLPDQEPDSDYTLTATVHRMTRSFETRSTGLDGFVDALSGRRPRPERHVVYTFTSDIKLIDHRTQQIMLSTQVVATGDYSAIGSIPDARATAELVQKAATDATRLILASPAASLGCEVIRNVDGSHAVLSAGFEEGVREKMVFAIFDGGRRDPVCYVRVTRIDRNTCRAEVGSVDFTALSRDRNRDVEKAFHADRTAGSALRIGMIARSEN